MSWVLLHEEMQKKGTSGAKNGAINCVFPFKIAPKKKKHDLKHHLEHEHDGFRHFFYANPEVGASKKNATLSQEKRTSLNCDV